MTAIIKHSNLGIRKRTDSFIICKAGLQLAISKNKSIQLKILYSEKKMFNVPMSNSAKICILTKDLDKEHISLFTLDVFERSQKKILPKN